jgi:SAM-dependent methyltransferase
MSIRAEADWYRSAFGPLTAAFWGAVMPEERVEAEAQFLAATLHPPPGGRLLDVPCGAGRHARALARRGFRVDGVDVSPHMLSQSEALPDGVSLRQGDMRALDVDPIYDGAYLWGNSFGYLLHEETCGLLRRLARALRPRARLAIDCPATAECLLPTLQPRTEMEAAGFRFTAERRYDLAEGALYVRYRIERNAETEEFTARQMVYTVAEVVRMAAAAGLELEALHGGIGGEPAAIGRPVIALFRTP